MLPPDRPPAAGRFATDELPAAALDAQAAARALAAKTMPAGALGRLGELACRIARLQGRADPRIDEPAVIVFAADHGIARAGVSAYPQAVTAQMMRNFLAGGAAVSVFARTLGLRLVVVDAGVADPRHAQEAAGPVDGPAIRDAVAFVDARIAPGTADSSAGAAMTRAQCEQALAHGAAVLARVPGNTVGIGEMGIGNTSAAALLTAWFARAPLQRCIGRGTGLDDAGLARKHAVLARAWALHVGPAGRADAARRDPVQMLAALGGFEIAMMAGAMIEAARQRRVVVVDGFVSTAALLAAHAIDPHGALPEACVFAHRSPEPGHAVALDALGAHGPRAPLLDLGMRLGEGSGAALAMPLVAAAADMLRDMATFESAGVAAPHP